MRKRAIRFITLVLISLGSYALHIQIDALWSQRLFQTITGLTVLYGIFRLILQELIQRHLNDEKMRYTMRKTISVLYSALFLIFAIVVWVDNPQTLVVAYGLVGAGVAVSLRDVFANFAGGINLFMTKPYSVGHRVEVDGTYGDVIDIGIFYTRLLEIREWVNGDQATGRTVMVPNSVNLSDNVVNYTQDNSFIWDEIQIPLKYGTDIDHASSMMIEAAEKEASSIMEKADKEMSKIRRKYYLSKKETQPQVFVELTDNWINLSLRYISDVRKRRKIYSDISRDILERFQESEIEIASETLDIS